MNEPGAARLMQGNEACAEAALAAGCRFFAGYPITPSTEIAEILAHRLPTVGGTFIQMEDEIASMAAIVGASVGGAKAMTATSGPGFSLMQENLGYAAMAEVPCVVVDVMRAGPSTGLPTSPAQGDLMQARWGTHGDHPTIALAPASVREVFTETVRAFNLAETYRTPVLLLFDEVLGHLRERVRLPGPGEIAVVERARPPVPPGAYLPFGNDRDGVPPLVPFGEGYRFHITGLYHGERGLPSGKREVVAAKVARLLAKVERAREALGRSEPVALDDAEVAIVAIGSVARSARAAVRALRDEGYRVGLFRPVTLWPFPDAEIAALARRVRRLIVAEMNLGQLTLEVERAGAGACPVRGCFQADGELMAPGQIVAAVREG
jgi:2-oxoglutarate ferredoxin oxidoreductase subunit alpha